MFDRPPTSSSTTPGSSTESIGARPGERLMRVAPLDLRQLGSIVGDHPDTLRSYLSLFHETTAPLVARIGAAIEGQEPTALRGLAHMLKGSCGSIGAREMAELGAALEAAAGRPDWAASDRLYRELQAAYDRVRTFTADCTAA